MTVPSPPSRLTTESRRTLALLAGDDLDPVASAEARALTDECPHCRGHFESVRNGLEALRRCESAEQEGGLWNAVRDGLTVAAPAAEPAASRPWVPAFAVTAAALLVGLFVYAPTAGETLPDWFEPTGRVQRAVDEAGASRADRPPVERVRTVPFHNDLGRGTLDGPRISYPR